MIQASIIILTWQGMPYIAACLDAVFAQTHSAFEVIVVDNASTDGTPDSVAASYPQARLIRNLRNAGFAAGCNAGIHVAQGDVIVLLNQDTVVERTWLAAIMQAMQQPGAGIVGCKCLYPDGRIQHAGGYLQRPAAQPQHYGHGEVDRGQYDEARDVEFVTGAALAISRGTLNAIGELDADLSPAYFEDIDWCFRARAAGFQVRYEPTARLTHHDGGSGRGAAQVLAYQRARVGFMLRHSSRADVLQFAVDERKQAQPIGSEIEAVARARAYLACVSRLQHIRARREAIYAADSSMRVSDAEWDDIAQNLLAARDLALRWARLRQMPILPDPPDAGMIALEQRAKLEEFTFISKVPVVGKFLSTFRSAWYSVAARWAVRRLAEQQTDFNRQVLRTLQLLIEDDNELADQLRRASSPDTPPRVTIPPIVETRGSTPPSIPPQAGGGKAHLTMQPQMRGDQKPPVNGGLGGSDPATIARELWDEMIAPAAAQMDVAPGLSDDANIFPTGYTIQYRNPLLGPVNSLLRRFINTEVRRYIDPVLRHQSRLNETYRETLLHLLQENDRLRRKLDELNSRQRED